MTDVANLTEAERHVRYVRLALTALRGLEDKKRVARALGISVRTLEAHATDVGAKGHRPIKSGRLAHLMTMAGDAHRFAAEEMERAARRLETAA